MTQRERTERELLYRFLVAPETHLKPALASGLNPQDFEDPRCGATFMGMTLMWEQHVASFAPLPGKTHALIEEFGIGKLEKILHETGQRVDRPFLYSVPCANLTQATTDELMARLKGSVVA